MQAGCGDRKREKDPPLLLGSPLDLSGKVQIASGIWNRLQVESPEPPTENGCIVQFNATTPKHHKSELLNNLIRGKKHPYSLDLLESKPSAFMTHSEWLTKQFRNLGNLFLFIF